MAFPLSLSAAISTVVLGTHHGARIYGSIVSTFVAVKGNWLKMFSKMDRWFVRAVLVRSALCIHLWMGCLGDRDWRQVVDSNVLVWRRIHVGVKPVSTSMAAVGVVL